MNDYISRKSVIAGLDYIINELNKLITDDSSNDGYTDIKNQVEEIKRGVLNIQPEDVQPVVHGEWVVSHIPDSMLWECNQCGFDCGAHSFNFCPKCGCKMDRKGADE